MSGRSGKRRADHEMTRVNKVERGWWRFKLLRLCPRVRAYGMTIYADADESFQPLYIARVVRALALIHDTDPRWLRHVQRGLRRIVVTEFVGNHYNPPLRMCVLSWRVNHFRRVEETALSLVHEATHGRIHDSGIPYSEDLRERIERACLRREAAFARRLPDGEDLIPDIGRRLEMRWWTPEQRRKRDLRVLREMEVPELIIRWVDWRWRSRQRRAERGAGRAHGDRSRARPKS